VAGKDPLAVFLTQLSRSPLVRKASAPGVYEIDRHAPLRIRQRLERLQAELREVTVATPSPVELGSVRARRHELDLAISQQERALEEALHVLRGDTDEVGARQSLYGS
jgi:DNA repair ATPase RecN